MQYQVHLLCNDTARRNSCQDLLFCLSANRVNKVYVAHKLVNT